MAMDLIDKMFLSDKEFSVLIRHIREEYEKSMQPHIFVDPFLAILKKLQEHSFVTTDKHSQIMAWASFCESIKEMINALVLYETLSLEFGEISLQYQAELIQTAQNRQQNASTLINSITDALYLSPLPQLPANLPLHLKPEEVDAIIMNLVDNMQLKSDVTNQAVVESCKVMFKQKLKRVLQLACQKKTQQL